MKNSIVLVILFIVSQGLFAQEPYKGVVLDKETNKPLEFVDVFCESSATSTNAEGKFELPAAGTRLNFSLIGYQSISKEIGYGQSAMDTVYLESKLYKLDEVIVTNKEFSLTDYIKIEDNYPFQPFTEAFFLRSYLKRNDTLVKLQDINGLIRRKQLLENSKKPKPKNNIAVEITNMRKALKKEKEIYFQMWTFNELEEILSAVATSAKFYDYKVNPLKDGTLTKLTFKANSNNNNPSTKGYYLIDPKDKAIQEFYLIQDNTNNNFEEKRGLRYRTIFFELTVFFEKDNDTGHYYLDKGKISATVELYDDAKSSNPTMYDANYLWYGLNRPSSNIRSNVSKSKDIFKLDYPYDKSFWERQKSLLLTEEMEIFVNNLDKSGSESGYISNME